MVPPSYFTLNPLSPARTESGNDKQSAIASTFLNGVAPFERAPFVTMAGSLCHLRWQQTSRASDLCQGIIFVDQCHSRWLRGPVRFLSDRPVVELHLDALAGLWFSEDVSANKAPQF